MNPESMMADLLNEGEALFESRKLAVVEFVLEKCMADSSPERPFGGPKLKLPTGETLLEHCIRKSIFTTNIGEMLNQHLTERLGDIMYFLTGLFKYFLQRSDRKNTNP